MLLLLLEPARAEMEKIYVEHLVDDWNIIRSFEFDNWKTPDLAVIFILMIPMYYKIIEGNKYFIRIINE